MEVVMTIQTNRARVQFRRTAQGLSKPRNADQLYSSNEPSETMSPIFFRKLDAGNRTRGSQHWQRIWVGFKQEGVKFENDNLNQRNRRSGTASFLV